MRWLAALPLVGLLATAPFSHHVKRVLVSRELKNVLSWILGLLMDLHDWLNGMVA